MESLIVSFSVNREDRRVYQKLQEMFKDVKKSRWINRTFRHYISCVQRKTDFAPPIMTGTIPDWQSYMDSLSRPELELLGKKIIAAEQLYQYKLEERNK